MKHSIVALIILGLAACGGNTSDATETTDTPSTSAVTSTVATNPNAGSRRYRYVELSATGDNGCNTSAEVGDELTQETTFTDDAVTVIFTRDDLPEGVEPGSRHYTEDLGDGVWREQIESSDGDGFWVHTIEFGEAGVTMTATRDGDPCFYSVRERIDS